MAPVFLFAHGAGAGAGSDWMRGWAGRLGSLGRVETFEYPYMRAGKKRPDRLPQLIEAHREALAGARQGHTGPVVLAGKSMGSRVGCHLALEEPVDALVCFGYPLVGAGKTHPVRDQVLLDLRTPILFIQGTRDALCPLDRLADVRRRMTAPNELVVVDEGDHSLRITKRRAKREGITQADVDAQITAAAQAFLKRWAEASVRRHEP
jgi:uncharacterized protein